MATTAIPYTETTAPAAPTGLWSWITTTDHKRIGVMYGVTAFMFFLIGGFEALIMRLQLGAPNNTLVSAQVYNELFTMHGTTMVFLAIMPLSAAFFNFVIPLQIGARDVAFPRLNAFSYWVFLLGGLFINFSFVAGPLFGAGHLSVAPNAGWFGYANLTSDQFSPGPNIDFWVIGLQILGIASLAAGFNFITTIINLRAPGMKWMRMPVFTWMSFVTQFLIITAFPVITVGLVFLLLDRVFGATFYNVTAGGDVLLWQHLFWMFGHPEVYILILPAMGIDDHLPLPRLQRRARDITTIAGIVLQRQDHVLVFFHRPFELGADFIAANRVGVPVLELEDGIAAAHIERAGPAPRRLCFGCGQHLVVMLAGDVAVRHHEARPGMGGVPRHQHVDGDDGTEEPDQHQQHVAPGKLPFLPGPGRHRAAPTSSPARRSGLRRWPFRDRRDR